MKRKTFDGVPSKSQKRRRKLAKYTNQRSDYFINAWTLNIFGGLVAGERGGAVPPPLAPRDASGCMHIFELCMYRADSRPTTILTSTSNNCLNVIIIIHTSDFLTVIVIITDETAAIQLLLTNICCNYCGCKFLNLTSIESKYSHISTISVWHREGSFWWLDQLHTNQFIENKYYDR